MTLNAAIEELVAATLHADDTRRADVVTATFGRVRLLKAIEHYRDIVRAGEMTVVEAAVRYAGADRC
jgi:hypothetical protein